MRSKCPGCGCFYPAPRNFSFVQSFPYRKFSESRRDALREDFLFDEDDAQAQELLAVESGWFLGRRLYDPTSQAFPGGALGVPAPETPRLPMEATPADFYDARNMTGRFASLESSLGRGPDTLENTLQRLKDAGMAIRKEVLDREARYGHYGPLGQDAWARAEASV